ncbi:MAG: putative transposase, partial [Acidimicrobiales bacterium]
MPDLLARAGMVPVRRGHLLPLRPAGSVPIGTAAALLETEDGGVASVWGMVQSCWLRGDVAGRRLGAVMLSIGGAASKSDIAAAFRIDPTTLRDWVIDFEHGGAEALTPDKRGPKAPSKLTAELAAEIRSLRLNGATLRAIATATGVSTDTVRRALAASPSAEARPRTRGVAAPPARSTELVPATSRELVATRRAELVPLARPLDRSPERALARFGLLQGAEPVICEGASLPFAGSLIVLPVLAVTGLLGALNEVYGSQRSAFYSVGSLALSLVFSALLGECRVEGLSRIDPVAIGRLIGLDRAPELGTMRRRMEELAELRRSSQLLEALARAHVVAHPEAMGILYIDGHVRAYHGGADLPRAHLARARIAMAATTDTWITDERGDALLVWSSPPGASLTGELKTAATEVRELLGPDARPTIGFDRGGYSPACFAELSRLGFDILTYRKAPFPPEPRSAFRPHVVRDGFGHEQTYFLSERNVRLSYDKLRRYFACRQVTRLDEASGHQTPVLTTWPAERVSAEVASSMFHRWQFVMWSARCLMGLDVSSLGRSLAVVVSHGDGWFERSART